MNKKRFTVLHHKKSQTSKVRYTFLECINFSSQICVESFSLQHLVKSSSRHLGTNDSVVL